MLIRDVEPNDLEALCHLCAEHAAFENLEFSKTGHKQALAALLFEEPRRIYGWVVEVEGMLVAYMTATIDYSTWNAAPFVYMDCLYVNERHRGHGLGKRLLQHLRFFAHDMDCHEIQWHTPIENDQGISFYNRMGATSLPKMRFFFTSDET